VYVRACNLKTHLLCSHHGTGVRKPLSSEPSD
jgi:hypothetical protein